MRHRYLLHFTTLAVGLALVVIVLGAYTRLTDAGLGCPDWPGCYGHMTVAKASLSSEQHTKAWTEMIHRYAAGSLGLFILSLLIISWRRSQQTSVPKLLPLLLVGLVIFQAMLGMWSVTLKLHPIVVMSHLLGGLTILSLLWLVRLHLSPQSLPPDTAAFRHYAALGLIFLIVQIALGAWVSANYAGLACIGFPYCNGQLLPPLHLNEAFNFSAPLGVNYQGGMLSSQARVTIQIVHRIGALVTFCYLTGLSLWLFLRTKHTYWRTLAVVLFSLILTQASLGILNVTHLLPLSIAVAHNGVAALLLMTMVTVSYRLYSNKEALR